MYGFIGSIVGYRRIMKQRKENDFVPFLFSSGELLISTMTRDFCFIGEVFPLGADLYVIFYLCLSHGARGKFYGEKKMYIIKTFTIATDY